MKTINKKLIKENFGSAFAIQDKETLSILQEPIELEVLKSESIINCFLIKYFDWIQGSHLNEILGLNEFPYKNYSNGTSETFDKFYLKNSGRRFRCLRGEYAYHKIAWQNKFNWAYLEGLELQPNDAVVISLPFADTGDKHPNYDAILSRCSELRIPVLVDCAYFGVCQDLIFNLSHACISDVTFSLSKTFPIAYARVGIRFNREDDDDTMSAYSKVGYNNKIGAAIGLRYLDNFSPDYMVKKYTSQQKIYCDQMALKVSKTILFGIDEENNYPEYNRGSISNRLSFHRQFSEAP